MKAWDFSRRVGWSWISEVALHPVAQESLGLTRHLIRHDTPSNSVNRIES